MKKEIQISDIQLSTKLNKIQFEQFKVFFKDYVDLSLSYVGLTIYSPIFLRYVPEVYAYYLSLKKDKINYYNLINFIQKEYNKEKDLIIENNRHYKGVCYLERKNWREDEIKFIDSIVDKIKNLD